MGKERKMKRDSKGRFVKGNTEGQQFHNSGGMAAAMQVRSVEARKQNKTLREALREALLEDGGGGYTKMEILARKAMENHRSGKLSFHDLRDLAEILGESKINITIEQETDERPEINIE